MMLDIIKEFNSKRNKVYLVQKDEQVVVLKIHTSEEGASHEVDILKKLQPNVNVPKLFGVNYNELLLEYVNGITALDYFLQFSGEKIYLLAKLMLSFCKSYCDVLSPYYLSDTNFRNFIVAEDNNEIKLYGVDFEDSDIGTVLNSAANLCAFAFLYDTDICKKKLYYNSILHDVNELSISTSDLHKEIIKSLKWLINRRGLNTNPELVFKQVMD